MEFLTSVGIIVLFAGFTVTLMSVLDSNETEYPYSDTIIVIILGILIFLIIYRAIPEGLFEPINNPTINSINVITFSFTSALFAVTSYFSIHIIRQNINLFRKGTNGYKSVITAMIIGSMFVGYVFIITPQINILLESIESTEYIRVYLPLAGFFLGVVLTWLTSSAKNSFFYNTIILTLIPGICWHSRILGSELQVSASMGLLFGALLVMGVRFVNVIDAGEYK